MYITNPRLAYNIMLRTITFTTNSGIAVGDDLKYRFLVDTYDNCCGCGTIVGWAFDNVRITCPAPDTPLE